MDIREITATVGHGNAIIRDETGREINRVPVTTLTNIGRTIWSNTGDDVSLRNGWSIEFPIISRTLHDE